MQFGDLTVLDSGNKNSYSSALGGMLDDFAKSFKAGTSWYKGKGSDVALVGTAPAKTASVIPRIDLPHKNIAKLVHRMPSLSDYSVKIGEVAAGPNSTELERALAQMAESHISSKAPLLSRYLLGFQMLKKSEDETRACGIFAYKVGTELVYIPVFCLNGELYGQELMYLVSKDQFVPSDEKWVNYLLSRKPLEPGKIELRSRSEIPQHTSYHPNLMRSGLKLSAYSTPEKEIPVLDKVYTLDALRRIFKEASMRPQPENDLSELLYDDGWKIASDEMLLDRLFKQSSRATKLASAWCDTYPAYSRLLTSLLGISGVLPYQTEWQKRAELCNRLDVIAKAPPTLSEYLDSQKPKEAAAPEFTKVAVYKIDEIAEHQFMYMPEETISQIYKCGYYVADLRTEKLAAVVESNGESDIANPSEPGLYDVFMADGTFKEAYVLRQSELDGTCENWFIYFADGSALYGLDKVQNVWASSKYSKPNWFNKLKKAGHISHGDHDEPSFPSHSELQGSRMDLIVVPSGDALQGDFDAEGDNFIGQACGDKVLLIATGDADHGFRLASSGLPSESKWGGARHTVTIPKSSYRLRVIKKYRDANLGTRAYWFELIRRGTVPVKIQKLNQESERYLVDEETHQDKSAALESLMIGHCLDQATAEMLLKEASNVYPRPLNRLRTKTAAFSGQLPQDDFSVVFPEKPRSSHSITRLPVEQEIETEEPVEAFRPGDDSDRQYKETYPGVLPPDEESFSHEVSGPPEPNQGDIQSASQAAANGQKDFVSSRMLMSLLRELDDDSLIYKYITIFEKACDTLGRLYMQLLWRTDAFEERFGRTQLKEFREMIVNLFRDMGDFICYLRERDVRPAPVLSLGATDIETEI
jgi:hypothetical protein